MGIYVPWSRQLAIRLSKLGHEIHAIDFQDNREWKYLGTSDKIHSEGISALKDHIAAIHYINFLSSSKLRYFLCGAQLKAVCDKYKADILLVLYGGGYATLAYYSKFRPYSIYAVGSDVLLAKGIKSWITRRNFNAADLVITNGLYLTERTKMLAPKATIKPLYMGVDADRFKMGTTISDAPVKIICTRGFTRTYNNEYLIHALKELSDPSMDFEVVFSSTGHTLKTAIALADKILPAEIRQRVTFLDGVSDSELLARLGEADIYISLSKSDGTSISLLEALSCGLFPILTDIPQNREWIDSKVENGLLVPFDQPEVLANALKKAIMDRQLREQARQFNRQLILDRADGRKNMGVLASELETVVAKNNLVRGI